MHISSFTQPFSPLTVNTASPTYHPIIVHCACAKQDTWLSIVTQLTITIAIVNNYRVYRNYRVSLSTSYLYIIIFTFTCIYYPKYSASSLGRPIVVITFLHRLYLPKFVYVVRTYFHARSTTEIFAQGTFLILVAFSWFCDITGITPPNHDVSWLALTRSVDYHKKSQLESCFSRKIAKHLCRWAAQQKGYTGLRTV